MKGLVQFSNLDINPPLARAIYQITTSTTNLNSTTSMHPHTNASPPTQSYGGATPRTLIATHSMQIDRRYLSTQQKKST